MSYSISDVENNLQGMIHGSSVSKIAGIYSLFGRAAAKVLLDIDAADTRRIQPIANALYDSILDYAAPADLKQNRIIDVRPSGERSGSDNLGQSYGKEFDLMKNGSSYAVRQNRGVKTVRISKSLTAPTLLSDCNSITTNGTWAASGVASDLAEDTFNFVSGSGSLSFNASGAGSAILTNSTMTAVDISGMTNGALFYWFYTPTGASVTSASLKWGSNSTNYYTKTVTATHFGQPFADGWNLVRFDQNSSTTVLAPDNTAIGYLQVTIVVTGALNALRLDNIVDINGVAWEMEYYSKYLFTDGTTGAWKEFPTDLTDTVNLDTDTFSLFMWKCAEYAFFQLQGQSLDTDRAAAEYRDTLARCKGTYKSEVVEPRQFYYRMR
jgi:hypothetical protein